VRGSRRGWIAGLLVLLAGFGLLVVQWKRGPAVTIRNDGAVAVTVAIETDIDARYPRITLAPGEQRVLRVTGQDQGIRVVVTREDGVVLASEQTYVTAGVDVRADIGATGVGIEYDLD